MPRTVASAVPATLSADTFFSLLAAGDPTPRQAFLRSFRRRLPPIARALAITHRSLATLGKLTTTDERNATTHMFLHVAFNSVYTSTLLLVEGYPLAAGNLMRHYAEATAMALLILDDEPNVWNDFDREGTTYPVHKAPHRLLQEATSRRLRKLLAFDPDKWRSFLALTKFYDGFSHASAFSLGFHMMFDRPGVIILGAEFDPAKRGPISIELRRRRSALRPLVALVRATTRVLAARAQGSAA